jgi:hypothetical protein
LSNGRPLTVSPLPAGGNSAVRNERIVGLSRIAWVSSKMNGPEKLLW